MLAKHLLLLLLLNCCSVTRLSVHLVTWSELTRVDFLIIRCFESFCVRQPLQGDPARVNQAPACVQAAWVWSTHRPSWSTVVWCLFDSIINATLSVWCRGAWRPCIKTDQNSLCSQLWWARIFKHHPWLWHLSTSWCSPGLNLHFCSAFIYLPPKPSY